MALNKFGMGIVIGARDMASKVFNRVGGSFQRMTRKVEKGARRQEIAMRSVAIGGALLLASTQAVGGITALTNAAGKFEQGIAGVGAAVQATTGELEMLTDAAIEAGIKTQFSPDEAREGLQSLATAGQTAIEATETLIPVLDLAAGSLGQLGVGEAATAVVGTLKSYGFAVKDATMVTDKLLRITQLSNFQTRDFETGLAKAASQAGIFNQSLDDTLITMGLMRNANIDASSASTAFRESLRRVGSDARAQQAIEAKSVKIFDDRTKKMRSIVDIMLDLDKKTKRLTDRERSRVVVEAFGARGLLAFNAVQKATFTTMRDGEQVVLKGKEAIAAMRQEMDKSTGTAEKFREKLLDTFEGQKTLLRGTLETFAVVLGTPLAQILKPIVKGIVDTLNTLLKWFKDLPDPVKKGIMTFVTFAGALTGLIGGIMLLKGVMGMLGMSVSGLIVTLGQLLVIGPLVLLFVGGLGVAAYAAFRAFQKNTGGIASSWQDMVTKITLAFKALKQMIFDVGFSDEVRKELAKAENEGVLKFIKGAERFLQRMGAFWQGLKRGFEEGVDALAESSAMRRLMDTMENVFSLFTGEQMGDSQEALKEWGERGAATGMKLAELGEKALNVINYLIDLGKRFAKFAATLSADDVEQGIQSAITGFKGMWETLNAIGEVVGVVADGLRILVNLLQTVGAFLSEGLAGIIGFGKTMIDVHKKTFAGDFKGAQDAVDKWRRTEVFTETRRQAGDVIRVFDPESRIGLETEDRTKFEREAMQRMLSARREAARLLAQRQEAGEDTTKVVALLEKLNTSIWEISRRPPPPLNVTLDADQVASKTREADERNKEGELESFDMVFAPG